MFDVTRGKVRPLWIGILVLTALLGLAARPSLAQTMTLSHARVHLLIVERERRIARLNVVVQLESQRLALLQASPIQNFETQVRIVVLQNLITRTQATIGILQQQINLLSQLDAAQDQFRVVSRRLRHAERQLIRLERSPIRTPRRLREIRDLRIAIQNDRSTLQSLQQQINSLQQQVAPFV
jgi:hypothetical protein